MVLLSVTRRTWKSMMLKSEGTNKKHAQLIIDDEYTKNNHYQPTALIDFGDFRNEFKTVGLEVIYDWVGSYVNVFYWMGISFIFYFYFYIVYVYHIFTRGCMIIPQSLDFVIINNGKQ